MIYLKDLLKFNCQQTKFSSTIIRQLTSAHNFGGPCRIPDSPMLHHTLPISGSSGSVLQTLSNQTRGSRQETIYDQWQLNKFIILNIQLPSQDQHLACNGGRRCRDRNEYRGTQELAVLYFCIHRWVLFSRKIESIYTHAFASRFAIT